MKAEEKKIANVLPLLPPDSEAIKLKNYYLKDLAVKLEIHRNTLSRELQDDVMFEKLSKIGYYKGKRILTRSMVKIICEHFGYENY